MRNPWQGRPLALLLCWLEECGQESRPAHLAHTPTFEQRLSARQRILSGSSPLCLWQLAACEREPGPEEGIEPAYIK